MDQDREVQKMPKWLKNLQENSWELELLISGGAIFSLFQLSDLFIDWVQNMRVTSHLPGAGMVMIIGMFGLKVLSLGFTLHLILRAYWLALICINYVFPNGINQSKLKIQKPYVFKHMSGDLKEQIIKVDGNCGLVMYMSIVSAFAIFGLIVLSIFLVAMSYMILPIIGEENKEGIFGLIVNLLLLYIIDLVSFGLLRKIPLLSYLTFPVFKIFDLVSFRPLYERSLLMFSTNIRKWRFILAALVFSFIAFLNAYSALYKVQHWPNILDNRDYSWQRTNNALKNEIFSNIAADLHYMENWNDGKSRPFGIGKKITNGNFLEVYIRYDKAWDVLIDEVDADPSKRFYSELFSILVDNKAIELNWHTTSKMNNDIGIMGMTDLSEIKDGEHIVTITIKEEYKKLHADLVNRPHLVRIPFWIDRTTITIRDTSDL